MSIKPLGKKSTAEEALRGVSLNGKFALVTGASAGIGAETARVLAQAGSDVLLAVRSVESGERTAQAIRAATSGTVTVGQLDLLDLASVQRFATGVLASGRKIDLLVNNAGIMATPLGVTAQGLEQQMGTNHLGHFLLTDLLRPALAPGARVVNLSSDLYRRGTRERVLATLDTDPGYSKRPYSGFDAYGDSKLANILFTRALARRLPEGITTFAVHPGVIGTTNLARHMGLSGKLFTLLGKPFFKSIPAGAATSVYAATAPELASRSGAYLSDCAERRPNAAALDDALAEQVWALSERWVAGHRQAAAA